MLLGGTRATSMEAERAALQVAGERLVQLMPKVQVRCRQMVLGAAGLAVQWCSGSYVAS